MGDYSQDAALFRAVFDSAPLGMALLDLEGRLQYTNPALTQQLKYAPHALLGKPLVELLHPQDQSPCLEALEKAKRLQQDVACGEMRVQQWDADYLWFRLNLCPVSTAENATSHYLARLEPPPTNQARAEQVYLLSFALDYTSDGVLLLDDQLSIRYLNDAASHLLGQARQYLLGQGIAQALPPLALHSDDDLREVIDMQRKLSLELTHPADARGYHVSVQFNRFRYDRRGYSLVLIQDVTDQQRMAITLRHNESQFRALIENTHDAIGRLTPDFRLLYANPALEALSLRPLSQAQGRSARYAFGNNSQIDTWANMVQAVANSGTSMEEELIHGVDGPPDQQQHYLVQLVAEYNTRGEVTSVLSLARNITDIRKAERRLAESNQQLRELASRRESTREEERKLIAQEIHDELGQHLTALRMGISMLRLQFGEQAPGLSDKVEHLMALCDRTIQVVRSIATSLRPAALNMGLYPALEWLIGEFRQHAQIACEFTTHCDEPVLADDQATRAFRVVQEALNNVARHSGASRAEVSLERLDDIYKLDITDNGCGFNTASVSNRSLGLTGMRERGISLGGEVVIFSYPGQGTTVQATFPVSVPQEVL
ncbi:PAS domain S-box-containing protein [Pseudomonas cuatrocienegasensis]|uniref:PAS domain S-box-containing protein n=1 Tax=Pseudomonas cuatrocienegasensis TaxID=543360 RepID=A0ABY1BJQ5_9PSED|nr:MULTISPECIES: PAS domain-containing protein [Pseudomonas]OEC35118.1 PAS domain S-box protein [Pseudomonas sp. 21C1]SER01807.1 PAS domain S-box-containing protein [Pseudomonas cuatrocienegasensis]